MAIVRIGGPDALAKTPRERAAVKHAAKAAPKKAAKQHAPDKHAAKKHAGKHAAGKHAAKKHAGKLAGRGSAGRAAFDEESAEAELAQAFHHLQRAGAILSLLETDTGRDLRRMLEDGIALYRRAAASAADRSIARCAAGLLRAAEHLGMAGLYAARGGYRGQIVAPPRMLIEAHLKQVQHKLDRVDEPAQETGQRLLAMARELLRRAGQAQDPHLEYELTMAADGLCTALEQGL